jgi:hypothetical protein
MKAGEDRSAVNDLWISQYDEFAVCLLNPGIDGNARVERMDLLRQSQNMDRPREHAIDYGRIRRPIIDYDNFEVFTRVEFPIAS